MVFIGGKTVRTGDRIAVWSRNGQCKVIDGPIRARFFMQKWELLRSVVATDDEYIKVTKRDGSTEHHPGPVSMFKDPVLDESVRVMQATVIDASQALVIETTSTGKAAAAAGGVSQRIVRGPARFCPSANESVKQTLKVCIANATEYLEVRKRDGQTEIMPGPCSAFADPLRDEGIFVRQSKEIDASQALVVNSKPAGATEAGSEVAQRIVRGPARFIPAPNEWVVQTLKEYTADENSYMEVRKRAGPIEIVLGPASRFLDPVLDESITVRPATMIDASEALVVYQHSSAADTSATGSGGAQGVDRRVVRGPARFIPRADEWIHHFEWSGMPKDGSKTTYQPRALKFDKLKVIPMTAYHNVSEVRTNDDTLITIKLMLFFELDHAALGNAIERMLDATADPIGDFINAASSDVIAFCSSVSYETFLNETAKLNELSSFTQLVDRAEKIGYKVTKVVFRGFQAGAKLQAMHDDAIQERTRLRLLEETQAQEQRGHDLRIAAEQQRAAKEAELQIEQARLAAEISLSQQKAKLAEQALVDDAERERATRSHGTAMAELRAQGEAETEVERRKFEVERQRNEEQLRVMKEMKALSVDITKVLVAQHEVPGNLIRLETDGGRGGGAAIATGGSEPGKGLLGALQLNL